MDNSRTLISHAYQENFHTLVGYFHNHINDHDIAEDLVQDVFVRLLEWNKAIDRKGIRSLTFKIARNVLCDYLRKTYVMKEKESGIHSEEIRTLYDTSTESAIITADIFRMECRIIAGLTPKRREVYILRRFHEKTAGEISEIMGISRRTAENHIFIGTKIVREAMRHCC